LKFNFNCAGSTGLLCESNKNKEVVLCKPPFKDIRSEFKLLETLRKLNLYKAAKTFRIDERVSEILHGNPTLGQIIFI